MRLNRYMAFGLVALFLALQYQLWFSPGGIVSGWHLQRQLVAQEKKNAALRRHNEALMADIQDLKQGDRSLEARARHLGLIKRGETFYQIVKPKSP